jgi:hypothetical protein
LFWENQLFSPWWLETAATQAKRIFMGLKTLIFYYLSKARSKISDRRNREFWKCKHFYTFIAPVWGSWYG